MLLSACCHFGKPIAQLHLLTHGVKHYDAVSKYAKLAMQITIFTLAVQCNMLRRNRPPEKKEKRKKTARPLITSCDGSTASMVKYVPVKRNRPGSSLAKQRAWQRERIRAWDHARGTCRILAARIAAIARNAWDTHVDTRTGSMPKKTNTCLQIVKHESHAEGSLPSGESPSPHARSPEKNPTHHAATLRQGHSASQQLRSDFSRRTGVRALDFQCRV